MLNYYQLLIVLKERLLPFKDLCNSNNSVLFITIKLIL